MTYKDEVIVGKEPSQTKFSHKQGDPHCGLDNVYKVVVCIGTESGITFLSRANDKFYNLKPGEAIGKHVTELTENSRLHIVAKTGKPEIGVILKVKDGEYRTLERIHN